MDAVSDEHTPSVAIVRPMFELLEDDESDDDAARWPDPFPDQDLGNAECYVSADILEFVTQSRISIQRRMHLERDNA